MITEENYRLLLQRNEQLQERVREYERELSYYQSIPWELRSYAGLLNSIKFKVRKFKALFKRKKLPTNTDFFSLMTYREYCAWRRKNA